MKLITGGIVSVGKHQVYKVRHRKLQNQYEIVERVYHIVTGFECLCGHKVFRQVPELYFVLNYTAKTYGFQCVKCKRPPILMTIQNKKLFEDMDDMLVWIGIREHRIKENKL